MEPSIGMAAGSIPDRLPRHIAERAAEPAIVSQRSEQAAALVGAAVEWGYDDGQILALALTHQPTIEKYGKRVEKEVARLLAKFRPGHQHIGQPCDRAGCANKPSWMSGERIQLVNHKPAPSPEPAANGSTAPPAEERKTLVDQFADSLLGAEELIRRPPPSWLVDEVIPAGGTTVLFGKPASGKSFTALDWANCVALGFPWQGKEVKQGGVIYIAAEGVGGLGIRVRAWKEAFGIKELPNIQFYPGSINLLDAERKNALAELISRFKFSMLVIDTMARSMVGGDENSARDVGLVVGAIDTCRAVSPDLSVVVVHHMSKDGLTYRGSSALEGAAEAMVECSADEDRITLSCSKQKDAAPFDPIRLFLDVVTFTDGSSSCALRAPTSEKLRENLTESQWKLRETFSQNFSSTGASRIQLREVSDLPPATFYRALNGLVEDGALTNTGSEKQPFYKLVGP